jgi:hypothetical protein
MSLENRFTHEEIFLLSSTPIQIGTVMAFAEGSGLGTIKEMFASSKAFVNGLKQYPHNEIIKGILPNLTDLKESMGKAKEIREEAIKRLKDKGIKSNEDLREQLLRDSRSVSQILEDKATVEEAREYKEWAMSIAENVAKAAKEGGILGFGGTRISAAEKEAFAQIAEAIGTTSSLS